MLLEILIGSAVVSRLKKNKKKKEAHKEMVVIEPSAQERWDAMLDETNTTKNQTNSFAQENKRNLISASAALLTSGLGALMYPPLGLVSIPFVLYASRRMHQKNVALLQNKSLGAETLGSATILGSMLMGHFFLASTIVMIAGVSQRLTRHIIYDSHEQLIMAFNQQQVETVWVAIDGIETEIAFDDLKVGDIAIVHGGETIPADGKICEGFAHIDQRLLTGETQPVARSINDQVFASSVVLSGTIYVRVEKNASDATVIQIAQILNETVAFKTDNQDQAENLAQKLVTPTLIASVLATPLYGLNSALAVVNSHPKNKDINFASITTLNYFNLAIKEGILVKDGRVLGTLNQVDTLVFDANSLLSKKVIKALKKHRHIKTIYIISEDDDLSTRQFAEAIGVNHYFAEIPPKNKVDVIKQLKQAGRIVCYVVDGIHDAGALKEADVSISINGVASVSSDTAQILLMDASIQYLDKIFELAKDFENHLSTTMGLMLIPTAIGLGGVFLFGFGLAQTVVLNIAGLFLGFGHSVLPILHTPEEKTLAKKSQKMQPVALKEKG